MQGRGYNGSGDRDVRPPLSSELRRAPKGVSNRAVCNARQRARMADGKYDIQVEHGLGVHRRPVGPVARAVLCSFITDPITNTGIGRGEARVAPLRSPTASAPRPGSAPCRASRRSRPARASIPSGASLAHAGRHDARQLRMIAEDARTDARIPELHAGSAYPALTLRLPHADAPFYDRAIDRDAARRCQPGASRCTRRVLIDGVGSSTATAAGITITSAPISLQRCLTGAVPPRGPDSLLPSRRCAAPAVPGSRERRPRRRTRPAYRPRLLEIARVCQTRPHLRPVPETRPTALLRRLAESAGAPPRTTTGRDFPRMLAETDWLRLERDLPALAAGW